MSDKPPYKATGMNIPGSGDGSSRLGRKRRSPWWSGQYGSPSMSADSTLSSKHATAKVLDVPEDIEPQPMFPYQDPEYMRRQREKPDAVSTRKGVVLRVKRHELRELIRYELEQDGETISEQRLDEFISSLLIRPAAAAARFLVGDIIGDIAAKRLAPKIIAPLARGLQSALGRTLPASVTGKLTADVASRITLIGKNVLHDLPDKVADGKKAIAEYDQHMAQRNLGPGSAFEDVDDYYLERLKEIKFGICIDMMDIVRDLIPGMRIAAGLVGTMACQHIDSWRSFLSIAGVVIPGDDSIEQGFKIMEEIDKRLENASSFTRPTGELSGQQTYVGSNVQAPVGQMPGGEMPPMPPMMESDDFMIKSMLQEFMRLDEMIDEDPDEIVDEDPDEIVDEDPYDEDVDEASGVGGIAGFVAPLHYDRGSAARLRKIYSRHYKVVGKEPKPKP